MDKPLEAKIKYETLKEEVENKLRDKPTIVQINASDDVALDLIDAVSDIDVQPFDEFSIYIPGFKWIEKFPKKITRSNWESWKMNWSNFLIELTCKSVQALTHLLRFPSTDVPLFVNGEKFSPDFHYTHNGKLKIFEFTSLISNPSAAKFENIVKQKSKYSDFGELTIIIIVANDSLPKSLRLGVNLSNIYKELRELYWGYIKSDKFELEKLKDEVDDIHSPISEQMEAFPFEPLCRNEDMEIEDKSSYSEIKSQLLDMVPKMKKFLDNNACEIPELVNIVMPKYTQQTHFQEHPLNRDLNKQRSGLRYGHSATLMAPYLCGWDSLTIAELVKLDWEGDTLIQNLIRLAEAEKETLTYINEIKRYIALIHSDQNTMVFQTINDKFNITSSSKKTAREQLMGLIKDKVLERRAKVGIEGNTIRTDWRLNKRGSFKTTDGKFKDHLGINIAKRERTEEDMATEDIKDMPDYGLLDINFLDAELELLNALKPLPVFDIKIDTAYKFEKSSSELMEVLTMNTKEKMKAIHDDNITRHMFHTMVLFRDIMMNIPLSDMKYDRTDGFRVIESRYSGTVVVATLHPNENTTGGIKIIQKVPVVVSNKLLGDNMFGRWSRVGQINDDVIIASDFFRLNLKFVSQYDSFFGSYIMNQVLWMSSHTTILNNSLWKSMYLNYSRQLILVSEIAYVLAMRALGDISFGLIDGKDKFSKLHCKDMRVGTIYSNIKTNYKQLYNRLEDFRATGAWKYMKEEFFGIPCESIQDYLFIAYTKQEFPKDDGFDDAKYAFGFWKDDKDQQEEWVTNPYNMDVSKGESLRWKMEEFEKHLFNDRLTKWAKVSFCSEFIQVATAEHYKEIKDRIRGNFLTFTKDVIPTDDLPKSKVIAPQMESNERITKLSENLKSKYPGLASVHLSESVFWTIDNYFEDADNFAQFLEEAKMGKHRKEGVIVVADDRPNTEKEGKMFIKHKEEPSLLEIALYNLYKYPKLVILVPVNKIQTGHGKRQFYVQTENGRNQNSILDSGFKPYLQASYYDMILTPGDRKYIKLGRDIEKIRLNTNPDIFLISTEDQSKFGDTYPLEAFAIKYKSLFDSGYLSEAELYFCLTVTKTMRNRYHVMPHATQEIIKKYQKHIQSNSSSEEAKGSFHMARVIEQIRAAVNIDALKDSAYLEDLGVFTKAVTENLGLKKQLGFALGVMNVVSTTLTVLHLKVVCDIIQDINSVLKCVAEGHSDDSIKFARLPRVKLEYFLSWNPDELIFLISQRFGTRVDFSAGTISFRISEEEYDTKDLREISCLFICLSLLSPRLVGQRPSLLKWFFGPVGEVLQVVYTKQSAVVPLFRYSSAIFKDLPGKSYASDLTNVCSRVLPLIQNGMSAEGAIQMQLHCNELVRWRFGILPDTMKEIRFDIHPVCFGGYLGLPTDFLEFGFDTNTVRLISMAKKNPILEKQLKLLLMTEKVWSSSTSLNNLEIADKTGDMVKFDLERENTNYGTVVMKEEFERIGDTFTDFEIVFSRNLKTLRAFTKQMMMYKRHIDATKEVSSFIMTKGQIAMLDTEMKREIFSENKEMAKRKKDVEDLKKIYMAFTHWFLYKKESFSMKVIRHLDKYTRRNFQESYVRVPQTSKVINRLGYAQRLMSNPFNVETGIETKKSIITITEVVTSVLAASSNPEIVVPKENEDLFTFMLQIYNTQVQVMLNRNYNFRTFVSNSVEQMDKIARLPYLEVVKTAFDARFGYKVNETVGALIEIFGGKKTLEETDLIKLEPWLLYDEKFREVLNVLERILRQINPSAKAIQANAPILVRLLRSQAYQIIMKASEADIVKSLLEDRGSIGLRFELTNKVSSGTYNIRNESYSKWQNFSGALPRLMFRCILFETPMNGTHISIQGLRFNLDLAKFLTDFMENRTDLLSGDINSIIALLSFNDNIKKISIRNDSTKFDEFGTPREDSVGDTLSKLQDLKVVQDSNFLDSYMFEGNPISIDKFNIKEIISMVFYNEIIIMLITIHDTAVIMKSSTSIAMTRLLVKIALHFAQSYKMRKISLDKLVAFGSGQYTYTSQKAFIKQSSDRVRKIHDFEFTDLLIMNAMIEDKHPIDSKNRLEDIWLHKGTLKYQEVSGKKIETPYVICPWSFQEFKHEFSFYMNDKLLFRPLKSDGMRQAQLRNSIAFIDSIIADMGADNMKYILNVMLTDSSKTQTVFKREIYNQLELYHKVDRQIFVESVEITVPSLSGSNIQKVEAMKAQAISTSNVQLIIDLLFSRATTKDPDTNLILEYERKYIIFFLYLVTCNELDLNPKLLRDIIIIQKKTKRGNKNLLEFSMSLKRETRVPQIMTLLTANKKIIDNASWNNWKQYISFYTIKHEDQGEKHMVSPQRVLKELNEWDEDPESNEVSYDRRDVISFLNPVNCSDRFMDAFLRECFATEKIYDLFTAIHRQIFFKLWGNSRVRELLLDPILFKNPKADKIKRRLASVVLFIK